jgi:hypothetical protein
MSGDITLYEPGSHLDVMVEAGAGGEVPQRGDAVEIVSASGQTVHVAPLTDPANFVGPLARTPTDYDETEAYNQGDVVDESALRLRHAVDWLTAEDASALNSGQLVVADADGVRAYDSAGGDEPHDIVGPVWTPYGNATGTADKVAVVRQR